LCFAHGYNICFDLIRPPADVDVVMVAPRMIGEVVRRTFEQGTGAPSYVAVHQDASGDAKQTMLAIAKGIGSTRAGAIELSFDQETAIDLFMEQTLMPIFTKTMLWAFDILVEQGFDPGIVALEMYGSGETAEVFEACAKVGFTEQLLRFHSRTAQYGELSRTESALPTSVRDAMRGALDDIQSGRFAREWADEQKAGYPRYEALIDEARSHPINAAEKRIAEQVDLGSSFIR
jgi:ketol-acid reductoisomerase